MEINRKIIHKISQLTGISYWTLKQKYGDFNPLNIRIEYEEKECRLMRSILGEEIIVPMDEKDFGLQKFERKQYKIKKNIKI
jgi:hypothetical protein